LCITAVTGYASGEIVTEHVKSHKHFEIDAGEVKALKDKLFNHPPEKTGIPYKKVIRALQEIIFPAEVCILKNAKSLKNALGKLEQVKIDVIPQMSAPDSHYLMKLIEVQGIAFMTEMYLRASLLRTETRAGHYREDYPDRDDKNWLKWIIINQVDNKLNLRSEPVALDRYKFKPKRYYSDNFHFPKLK
jgi:succinate dehydrogenase / fumarate reductase flavoprotein subunit